MIDNARKGVYHDCQSELAMPSMALAQDLRRLNDSRATDLLNRVVKGEFDATKAEWDVYCKTPRGAALLKELTQ